MLASDFYIVGFFMYCVPALMILAVLGAVSLWRRWRFLAVASGLACLLVALKLLLDAEDRQDDFSRNVIATAGVVSVLSGAIFVVMPFQQKRKHKNHSGQVRR